MVIPDRGVPITRTRLHIPPQAEVTLRTLGGLELPGSPFARPKPLLLLAYLALEGPKDKRFLAELFFPESSDRSGSLRQTLTRLRRAGSVVENDRQRVWTPLCSDASAFLGALEARDLERAVGLYGGALLTGVALPELGVELEEWVYGTRAFLAGALRGALLTLAEEASSLGAVEAATRYAEQAYRTEEAPKLEPETFAPLYTLLAAGNSPFAPAVRKAAEEVGIALASVPGPHARPPEKPPPTREGRPHLPSHGGPFVGREAEQHELAELLARPEVRLLTLLGPGGVGKTRLALEVAAAQRERLAGGVVVAALEALTSADGLPEALAGALGLRLQPGDDALTRVTQALGEKQVLLVLDNFEQLLAATPTLEHLLASCPHLKLLVTSRERLGVEAGWAYLLEGLTVPPNNTAWVDALTFDAVQLFVEQAKRSRLSFNLTPADLPFVLQICDWVQGSPLGLELAAGWVKLLSCEEIAGELAHNLDLLATTRRDAPARQESVRAVFEGSWNRLSETERSVLKKLSVFRGGFTRQAAAEVAGATLPVLARLLDKSLLRVSDRGRYDRHTLVSAYTQEKLAGNAREEAETKDKYGAYFLELAEASEHGLKTDRQKVWLEQLEAEFDNLRTAFDGFVTQEATVEQALRLGSALHHFRWFRHARKGQAWLERALPQGIHEHGPGSPQGSGPPGPRLGTPDRDTEEHVAHKLEHDDQQGGRNEDGIREEGAARRTPRCPPGTPALRGARKRWKPPSRAGTERYRGWSRPSPPTPSARLGFG